MGKFKRCPDCGRIILTTSEQCRYCCSTELTHPLPAPPPTTASTSEAESVSSTGRLTDTMAKTGAFFNRVSAKAADHASNLAAKAKKSDSPTPPTPVPPIPAPATPVVPDAPEADSVSITQEADEPEVAPKAGSKKAALIIGIAVLVLLAVGVGIFFLNTGATDTAPAPTAETEEVAEETTNASSDEPENASPLEENIATVYEGKIGKSAITMIVDQYGNGKYFYNKYGNASDNYLLLYNERTGEDLFDPSTPFISLTEFDKDFNLLGGLNFSYENGQYVGSYFGNALPVDLVLYKSNKSAAELDPDFNLFLDRAFPAMAEAYSRAIANNGHAEDYGDIGDEPADYDIIEDE